MKVLFLIPLSYAISISNGLFFGRRQRPDWNSLKVTWSLNPFGSYSFDAMPRTVDEAAEQEFTMVSDCGEIPEINGKRFVKGGDYSLVLLYGVNGYIAGIQIGVPHNSGVIFPPVNQINHPFVRVYNRHFLTAYFTNPATICSSGRTSAQYAANGTGDSLYIQNGTDPVADYLVIPKIETVLTSTKWTRGHCFYTMGVHYWYNVKVDMSCDDFFPVFLLYNGGKLNAFGWALGTDMASPRMEHPPKNLIQTFMNPVPQCLMDATRRLSTMHIYMTNPLRNYC
ncbi:uncharacterized protein LOC110441365 [Mizuhopecten yessoensis]|uniref:Uncharacterized protein n=1 Tax=Mizuhopecten yessoensis TaxID=6573 RepID=A0A210R127_MIZYE|nr:uncharacterized protein LOC110441365 [Mizuhopecten yessoensis]OWF54730.1 hypothetical protein KP79_PYT00309 [Mizuhopecten yessoensis]